MKWIQFVFLVGCALGSGVARGDLLVMHHNGAFRHDEKSGALLSSAANDGRTETTDAAVYGPDGNIYAAGNSLGAGSVLRFDGRTGAFLDFFVPERGSGFSTPLSLAFGPDGDLYITWIGPLAAQWPDMKWGVARRDGKTGANKEPLVPLVPLGGSGAEFPMDIQFGADGNAYVLQGASRVRRFKVGTGEDLGTFATWEGWKGWTNYGNPSITFGPDGNLYWLALDVRRFDGETGAFMDTFISQTAAGLEGPVKIIFGPDGDLYVGEGKTLKVKRFDGKTGVAKGILVQGEFSDYNRMTGLQFSTPRLRVVQDGSGTAVRWPQTWGRFALESRNALEAGGSWESVLTTPTSIGNELSLGISQGTGLGFFRLRRLE